MTETRISPVGGDGREDVEANDAPPGKRPDAEEIKQRRIEHEKQPIAPEDAETRADHTPGTPVWP